MTHTSRFVLVFLLWPLNKCVCAKQREILPEKIYFSDQTPTGDANQREQTLLRSRKVKANTKRGKTSNTSFQEELLSLQKPDKGTRRTRETYEFIDCFNARVTAEDRGRRNRIRSRIFHGNREIILQ